MRNIGKMWRADISKLESDLRKAQSETKTAGARMSKAFSGMTKSVLKFAAAAAGIAAVSKILRSMVKNASDEEAANKRLEAAMKSAGVHSDELTKKLSEQAKAFDLLSVASETELVHAQAFLLNMGVTTDKMEVALGASTNLAAAMGWDLTSAVRNVGKTMGGFAGELAETIPELKAMSRETLQAGAALDFIYNKFAGQSVAQLSTFQGKVKELGDAWEVFSAAAGSAATKNDDLLEALNKMNKVLRDPDYAKGTATVIGGLIQTFVWLGEAVHFASGAMIKFSAKYQKGFDGLDDKLKYLLPAWVRGLSKLLDAMGMDQELADVILYPDSVKDEIARDNAELWRRVGLEARRIQEEEGALAAIAYIEAYRRKMEGGSTDATPDTSGGKPPGGSLLTEQELKANRDFLDKLLSERHTYNEDYLAMDELRVAQEIATMERLKLSEEELAQAKELIRGNSNDRIIKIEEDLADATDDLRVRSRDTYLNATGQEILAIEERLAREIEAYEEMEQKGEDWSQQKIEAAAIAQAEIADIQAEEKKEWDDLFSFMQSGFNDALATMLMDGELTFKALAESFLREFIQLGIGKLTAGMFDNIGSLFKSPGGATPGFLPGFASGGPLGRSSGPVLVGERGPELFIPHTSGFVATNASLENMAGRGGGGGVNVTVINNSGEESSTTEKQGPGGTRDIEILIGAAVSKNISRGGEVDQAIRNSYGINRVGRHGL